LPTGIQEAEDMAKPSGVAAGLPLLAKALL
jgi:hypothetical protein